MTSKAAPWPRHFCRQMSLSPALALSRGTAVPVSCSPHPGGGVRQACCIVGLTLQEQADGGLRFPLRRKEKKKRRGMG